MIIASGIISMFVLVFGAEGRGDWSRNIAIVGGLLWLGSVVWGFYTYGVKGGIIYLVGTFVWGAILTAILKPLVNPHGH